MNFLRKSGGKRTRRRLTLDCLQKGKAEINKKGPLSRDKRSGAKGCFGVGWGFWCFLGCGGFGGVGVVLNLSPFHW